MMKVAVQMDHIASAHIKGDTTFALCLAAQRRGHQLFHYTPDRLSMSQNTVKAWLEPLFVVDEEGRHYRLEPAVQTDLRQMDVILLRQDPPFNMNYITSTFMLEQVQGDTLVVNDPFWVRNSPEKIFVTEFADLMPQTLITRNFTDVQAFHREFGDIIIKPLYGNGGAGVFHLKPDDRNLTSLCEMFTQLYPEPFIIQQYLKEVRQGDKRIILLDGEPVGAINRVPAAHEERSNMHVGGKATKTELTQREIEICQRIAGPLQKRGLRLVGIDVIGDYLTEINVTSPTGIREIKRFGGADIAEMFWEKIENDASARS